MTDPEADRGAHSSWTAALVLRVWFDTAPGSCGEDVRARLLSVVDGTEPATWATAVGENEVSAAVTRWLREVAHAPDVEAVEP